jgi:hypothetical protein
MQCGCCAPEHPTHINRAAVFSAQSQAGDMQGSVAGGQETVPERPPKISVIFLLPCCCNHTQGMLLSAWRQNLAVMASAARGPPDLEAICVLGDALRTQVYGAGRKGGREGVELPAASHLYPHAPLYAVVGLLNTPADFTHRVRALLMRRQLQWVRPTCATSSLGWSLPSMIQQQEEGVKVQGPAAQGRLQLRATHPWLGPRQQHMQPAQHQGQPRAQVGQGQQDQPAAVAVGAATACWVLITAAPLARTPTCWPSSAPRCTSGHE